MTKANMVTRTDNPDQLLHGEGGGKRSFAKFKPAARVSRTPLQRARWGADAIVIIKQRRKCSVIHQVGKKACCSAARRSFHWAEFAERQRSLQMGKRSASGHADTIAT